MGMCGGGGGNRDDGWCSRTWPRQGPDLLSSGGQLARNAGQRIPMLPAPCRRWPRSPAWPRLAHWPARGRGRPNRPLPVILSMAHCRHCLRSLLRAPGPIGLSWPRPLKPPLLPKARGGPSPPWAPWAGGLALSAGGEASKLQKSPPSATKVLPKYSPLRSSPLPPHSWAAGAAKMLGQKTHPKSIRLQSGWAEDEC